MRSATRRIRVCAKRRFKDVEPISKSTYMMTKNTFTQLTRRPVLSLIITVVIALLALDRGFQAQSVNPIPTENAQAGAALWDIVGAGDPSIQGFATDISVN